MAEPIGTRYDRNAARARIDEARSQLTGSFLDQAGNSPYDAEFTPNWFQSLFENVFGDYSARDAFYQQQDQAESERINSLLEAQRQQEYDSPEAQAQRMRNAGQNPDLLGTGGVAGAAKRPEDETPPAGMANENPVTPDSLLAGVRSAIDLATQFASPTELLDDCLGFIDKISELTTSVQNRRTDRISNALKAAGFDSVLDYAVSREGTSLQGKPIPKDSIFSGLSGVEDQVANFIDPSFRRSEDDMLGLSKRDQKYLNKLLRGVKFDNKGKLSPAFLRLSDKYKADNLEDRKRIVEIVNSPGYSDLIGEWASERFASIDKYKNDLERIFTKTQIALQKFQARTHSDEVASATESELVSSAKAGLAQNQYHAEYYGGLDGEVAAAAENEKQLTSEEQAIYERALTEIKKAGIAFDEEGLKLVDRLCDKYHASPLVKAKLRSMVYQDKRFRENGGVTGAMERGIDSASKLVGMTK